MKKIFPLAGFMLMCISITAQDNVPSEKQKKKVVDLSNRQNDHFMFQFGITDWAGIPDSIRRKAPCRSFNIFFLFDFPFKTNPNLSIALGPGIASDHILFSQTYIDIKEGAQTVKFNNLKDTNHYKKTKLATTYLEVPVELRYSADPLNGNGFKAALGVRAGALLNAHTRYAKFQDKNGKTLSNHVLKESSKEFFIRNRLVVTARAGYKFITLFGSFQVTGLIKDGRGPVVRPFTIGITLSGL